MIHCFQRVTVICRPHLGETIRVAVVVGTVLFAINQLDVVLAGKATWVTWLKAALTYLVPFLVANYGLLVGSRGQHETTPAENR
jgi:hypothetical protein